MMVFWIMAALMASLAGLIVLSAARRGETASDAATTAASAAELAELDRLKTRGLLDEAGWTAARAEAGRRILTAEREIRPLPARPGDRRIVLVGAVLTVAAALGLYWFTAAPGLSDQPYVARVTEWARLDQPLEPAQVAAVVARQVERRPSDVTALTMLGAARFQAGDPIGAASAFRRALALNPDDAQSWARLGESLVQANQGDVDADAEAAFREALRRDPGQLGARYFLGEAALARGDSAEVRDMWLPLISALDPADPRRVALEDRLPEAPR